jgi:hypothetical protein
LIRILLDEERVDPSRRYHGDPSASLIIHGSFGMLAGAFYGIIHRLRGWGRGKMQTWKDRRRGVAAGAIGLILTGFAACANQAAEPPGSVSQVADIPVPPKDTGLPVTGVPPAPPQKSQNTVALAPRPPIARLTPPTLTQALAQPSLPRTAPTFPPRNPPATLPLLGDAT